MVRSRCPSAVGVPARRRMARASHACVVPVAHPRPTGATGWFPPACASYRDPASVGESERWGALRSRAGQAGGSRLRESMATRATDLVALVVALATLFAAIYWTLRPLPL